VKSRVFSGKRSLAWLWLKRLAYLVPPTTDEIVSLESNPSEVNKWLKQVGVRQKNKYGPQEKDRITLLTSALDGGKVFVGERPVVERKGSSDAPVVPNAAVLRHQGVPIELAPTWVVLVDTIVSSLLAIAILWALRSAFPDIALMKTTPRGNLGILLALIGIPTFSLLQVLWRRVNTSNDWKLSWIAGFVLVLVFYIILTPAAILVPANAEFWGTGVSRGFKELLDSGSEALTRMGMQSLKTKPETSNSNTQSSQSRLQALFSEGSTQSGNAEHWKGTWLYDYLPIASAFWFLQLLAALIALPIGLCLYISIQRRVKSILQFRGSPSTSMLSRILEHLNSFAMPLLTLLLWSPYAHHWILAFGFYVDEERLLLARRMMSATLAVFQLATLRSALQAHLDTGRDITEYLLGSNVTSKGRSIQANLRALAKSICIVAVELVALPVIHIGLLFARSWYTDTLYIATLLVIWPTSIMALYAQSSRE